MISRERSYDSRHCNERLAKNDPEPESPVQCKGCRCFIFIRTFFQVNQSGTIEPDAEEYDGDEVKDGSVSLRGNPVKRSKTGGWTAAYFIHLLVSADALSINGIAGDLVAYLITTLQISDVSKISNIVNCFVGIAYSLPIAWGYFADTLLGRYVTILAACAVSATGLLVLTLSASLNHLSPGKCIEGPCKSPTHAQLSWFYSGLYLISAGSAGLKPCIASLGRDQFDETHSVEQRQGQSFFTSFYANVNVSSLFAVTVVFYVQNSKGYGYGWGIIAVYFGFSMLSFVFATPLYRHRPPEGSPITSVVRVIVLALKNIAKPLPPVDELYELDDKYYNSRTHVKLARTDRLRFLEKAAIHPEGNQISPGPWGACTLTQVEEFKSVIQILPIWACTIVVYILFAQVTTVTVMEAITLDRHLGKHFIIPAGTTAAFILLGALCFIPVYEYLIVPSLRRITGHPNGLSDLQRMGTALFIAILSMIVSAAVEGRRVSIIKSHFQPSDYVSLTSGAKTLPMSVFWLLPQYVLLGVVEFLLAVAQLNFFYSETPESMRSIATSLFFTTISIGYFVATGLVRAVNERTYKKSANGGWISGLQVFQGGLRKYYYMLAVITSLNFFLFMMAAYWHTLKKVERGEQISGVVQDSEIAAHLDDNVPHGTRANSEDTSRVTSTMDMTTRV